MNEAACPFCNAELNPGNLGSKFVICSKCEWLFPTSAASDCQQTVNWDSTIDVGMVLRDRYRLEQVLGRGAQGITFRAEHLFVNHPCVIKVVPYRVGDSRDRLVQKLRAEAHSGFKVNSPYVVRVMDGDVIDDHWFFVMELIEGGSLSQICRDRMRVAWQQVAQIGFELASGLAAIHDAGLMHGDINPSNVLMGRDGRCRIADLGVAATFANAARSDDRLSTPPMGTPGYAAPELYADEHTADPRTDLYSLGVTLFELLHGHLPFAQKSTLGMLVDLQNRRASWPTNSRDDVPASIVAIVLSLLEADREKRIQTATDLCNRLAAEIPQRATLSIAAPREAGTPHGVVVPAFQNLSSNQSEDWLSAALSDYLARALWQQFGLYVIDRDEHARLQLRMTDDQRASRSAPLEAARLLGAATIIQGQYERKGDQLWLKVSFARANSGTIPSSLEFEGPLASLVDLQSRLLTSVARSLGAVIANAKTQTMEMAPPSADAQEHLVKAKQCYLRGDYPKAIEACQISLDTDPNLAEAIGLAAACQSKMGRYVDAEQLHRRQMEIAGRLNDSRLLLEAHANVGAMNYFRGNYEAALQSYQTSIKIARQNALSSELGKISNNLGFTLYQLDRKSEAEAAYRVAIETHKANAALISLIGPYNGLGNVLRDQGRLEEAISYHRRALALTQESDDRVNEGICFVYLGKCAALQNRSADAKQDLAMALNLLEETTFWNGLARVYDSMTELNLRLGDWLEACRCADKKIELARQHANARMESGAWRQKAKAFEIGRRAMDAAICITRAQQLESPDLLHRAGDASSASRSVA